MTIRDLNKKLDDFINNEFKHLRWTVTWILCTSITTLLGIIVVLLIKK
jgi:hypothetical protein